MMRTRSLVTSLAFLSLAACGPAGGVPGGAPVPVGSMRPEDHAVVGDFRVVQAIASSFERVYVVYATGVGIWSPLRRAWEVPREAPDRFTLPNVRIAAVDPLDQSLWLGGADGLVHFDPFIDRWERHPLPGRVVALAIDQADPTGIWARTQEGWWVVPRIGTPRAASPPNTLRTVPTLEDAYRDLPALRSFGATLSVGPGLGAGRLTAAAPAPDGSGWFIGTDTRGLLLVDRVGVRAEPMPFGLPGEVVGALAVVPGTVYVATDAGFRSGMVGLAALDESLSQVRWFTGNAVFGLGADAIRRILPGQDVLWLATDRGVVRLSLEDEAIRRWDESDGLQDQRILALAWWRDGLAVGTARGLFRIDAVGEVSRLAFSMIDPVYALHVERDTLWIGAARGIGYLAPGDSAVQVPVAWRGIASPRDEVRGIGAVRDTLVAMTRNGMAWRDPVTGEWVPGAPFAATTGTLRAFHATAAGAWLGGDRAAVLVSANGAVLHVLRVGLDLPDLVTAIATGDDHLWVGTARGLVRIRLGER